LQRVGVWFEADLGFLAPFLLVLPFVYLSTSPPPLFILFMEKDGKGIQDDMGVVLGPAPRPWKDGAGPTID